MRRLALLVMVCGAFCSAGSPVAAAVGEGLRSPSPSALTPARVSAQMAREAMVHEDAGRYGLAMSKQKELRARLAPDADLELIIALNEARSGLSDSAWVRLFGSTLSAALEDTAGFARRRDYPFERDGMWVNGSFDGWYWYVARARAELALLRGEWSLAYASAMRAVRARPLSGVDMLLLGIAAGRDNRLELAEAAAAYAAYLSPSLPEAHHLLGLHLWRRGLRRPATQAFESAIAADSMFKPAALALTRLRLPGSRPDTLPSHFLTGPRRPGEITSSIGPKPEERRAQDTAPMIAWNPVTPLADSLRQSLALKRPLTLYVSVLIDASGRARLIELPYVTEDRLPIAAVHHISRDLARWRFVAPKRSGAPIDAWVTAEYSLQP